MAKRFKRRRDGRVVARLEDTEIALLARLFADVQTLLEPEVVSSAPSWAADLGLADLGGDPDRAAAPEDSALARLLPDARRDDAGAAAEFRRLTERSLRERKREALRTTLDVLRTWSDEVGATQTMTTAQARDFTAALTDVRLVLADRIGIETDADAEALHDLEDGDPDDPGVWLAMVYDFTTWVQESLTEVLLDALPDEGDGRRTPPGGPRS